MDGAAGEESAGGERTRCAPPPSVPALQAPGGQLSVALAAPLQFPSPQQSSYQRTYPASLLSVSTPAMSTETTTLSGMSSVPDAGGAALLQPSARNEPPTTVAVRPVSQNPAGSVTAMPAVVTGMMTTPQMGSVVVLQSSALQRPLSSQSLLSVAATNQSDVSGNSVVSTQNLTHEQIPFTQLPTLSAENTQLLHSVPTTVTPVEKAGQNCHLSGQTRVVYRPIIVDPQPGGGVVGAPRHQVATHQGQQQIVASNQQSLQPDRTTIAADKQVVVLGNVPASDKNIPAHQVKLEPRGSALHQHNFVLTSNQPELASRQVVFTPNTASKLPAAETSGQVQTQAEVIDSGQEVSEDNEVITYLNHVVREATRVRERFANKRIPTITLQQCKYYLFEMNIFAALERLELTSQSLDGQTEETAQEPQILETILEKIQGSDKENRSTKRKRKRTQENKREPRDEPKELKEPKNDAAQQEQTQEKVETDPPPEENKGDARRKQTQTRSSRRLRRSGRIRKSVPVEVDRVPDAEKPDPDDWTRESLSKAREERRKTKAEPEGTIALAKVAPTADSVTEKENRPVPSRDEEDGEPEGIGDDSRAVPPAPPREPPADYAEPEQFVEREVAPDQLTMTDITSQIRASQKPADAIELNTCAICSLLCESKRDLTKHIKTHANGFPFACTKCPKSFTTSAKLAAHERGIHSKKPLYKCEECNKKFFRYDKYRHHLALKHAGAFEWECKVCGKGYFSQSTLTRHMNKKHNVKNAKAELRCSFCDRLCGNARLLAAHVRTHTGERPYICMTCGMAFSCSSTLSAHKRTHSGERPYICTTCKKGFTQMSALKTHKRIHSGDKPYKCQFCGMGFNQSGHLQRHEKRHTQTKDFVCHLCGKGFIETHSLKVHVRTHTGERPFKCTMCTWAFSARTHLVRHLKTHEKSDGPRRRMSGKARKDQNSEERPEKREVANNQPPQQQQQQQQQPAAVVEARTAGDQVFQIAFHQHPGFVEKRVVEVHQAHPAPQVQQVELQVQQQQQQGQGDQQQHVTTGKQLTMVNLENGSIAVVPSDPVAASSFQQATDVSSVSHAHLAPITHMVPLTSGSAPQPGFKWNALTQQTFPLVHVESVNSHSPAPLQEMGAVQQQHQQQQQQQTVISLPDGQSEGSSMLISETHVVSSAQPREVTYQ